MRYSARRLATALSAGTPMRHILTLSTSNLIAQAITVAAIPVLSRIYGPAAFGILAIYTSLAVSAVVIATGRYEFAIILPRSRQSAIALKRLSRSALWTTSIILEIAILIFLTPIAQSLNMADHKYWLTTLPLHVILLGELSIQNIWHTRHKDFRTLGHSRIIQSIAIVSAQSLLGWLIISDVRGLICGLLIAQLGALSVLVLREDVSPIERRSVSRRRILTLMRIHRKMPLLNAPTALTDGARILGINLVIGGVSQNALGQFSMAQRSVQAPLSLLGSALHQVYFQRMSSEARGQLFPLVMSTITRVALVTFPLFTALFFLLPWLLPTLLGHEWSHAGIYAQALVPWLFLNLVTSPLPSVFLVTGTQGRQAVFGLIYAAAPLATLMALRSDMFIAVWGLSAIMTLLLLGFAVMALVTARNDDKMYRY